jgi:hypothetical protein
MNLFANNTGKETIKQPTPPELARQAVGDAAAENVQAALQRQFPGMSFGATAPVVVAEVAPAMPQSVEPVAIQQMEQMTPVGQNPIDASLNGAHDEFTQAA